MAAVCARRGGARDNRLRDPRVGVPLSSPGNFARMSSLKAPSMRNAPPRTRLSNLHAMRQLAQSVWSAAVDTALRVWRSSVVFRVRHACKAVIGTTRARARHMMRSSGRLPTLALHDMLSSTRGCGNVPRTPLFFRKEFVPHAEHIIALAQVLDHPKTRWVRQS